MGFDPAPRVVSINSGSARPAQIKVFQKNICLDYVK